MLLNILSQEANSTENGKKGTKIISENRACIKITDLAQSGANLSSICHLFVSKRS
ncbi:hypothetical protein KFE69_03320 [bacterium SCSIO 12844]|nr:hypothetical protein KFE69_03320 [bacterium SCSIO 12844]